MLLNMINVVVYCNIILYKYNVAYILKSKLYLLIIKAHNHGDN